MHSFQSTDFYYDVLGILFHIYIGGREIGCSIQIEHSEHHRSSNPKIIFTTSYLISLLKIIDNFCGE